MSLLGLEEPSLKLLHSGEFQCTNSSPISNRQHLKLAIFFHAICKLPSIQCNHLLVNVDFNIFKYTAIILYNNNSISRTTMTVAMKVLVLNSYTLLFNLLGTTEVFDFFKVPRSEDFLVEK